MVGQINQYNLCDFFHFLEILLYTFLFLQCHLILQPPHGLKLQKLCIRITKLSPYFAHTNKKKSIEISYSMCPQNESSGKIYRAQLNRTVQIILKTTMFLFIYVLNQEKRRIQEDIAKKRREIEEEKLKLQYLKVCNTPAVPHSSIIYLRFCSVRP